MIVVNAILLRIVSTAFVALLGVIIACEAGHPEAVNTAVASAVGSGVALYFIRYFDGE